MFALPDSTFVCGTTTNEQGKFRLENIFIPDKTFLRVSYIGYQITYIKVFENNEKIVLQPNSIEMNGVTVVAHRQMFKSRGTDVIVDIQHSLLKDFGMADDIIGKLPMVSGSNGQYSVFGKANIAVYVNRRRITDASELSRLQSKDIATIEVISNPGAGYDADIDAVIKINLKRNTDIGLGGMASVMDALGRRASDSEQVQLTYNTSIANSFLTFSNSLSRYSADQTNLERFSTDTSEWLFKSNMPHWKSNYYNFNLSAGSSLYFSNGGILGGQLSLSKETGQNGGNSMSQMMRDNVMFEWLSSDIHSRSNYDQWLANIYYETKIGKKLQLNFNGDYLHRKASGNRMNGESGSLTALHTVRTDNSMTHSIYAGLLTLNYAVKDRLSLIFGTNFSYVKDNKDNNGFDNENQTYRSLLSSKENKYAVFTECNFSINKLNAQIGLRYEIFKMLYENPLANTILEDRSYHRL